MKNIKIFVSCHKESEVYNSDIIKYVQVGRALADKTFEGMIGDNTGDNISDRNPRYNELTTQYWVWKNYDNIGNPDYVGFMHYRRHFIFDKNFSISDKESWLPGCPIYNVSNCIDEIKHNLSDNVICDALSGCADCYAITPYDIKFFNKNDVYIKEHYLSTIIGSKRVAWNTMCDVINELYPNYSKILHEFSYGSLMNCCNMFIMNKKLFFEYSEFCFNILQEIEKRVDYSTFNTQELRFLGFLAEYLLSIFIMKLSRDGVYNIKYLNAYLITDVKTQNRSKIDIPESFISTKRTDTHKIFNFFGIKLKLRYHNNMRVVLDTMHRQEEMLSVLTNKVTDLQEAILANKSSYSASALTNEVEETIR